MVKALVCTFSPANTLATPVSLRLTADAIMQDLAPVAPNRLLTPWLVVGCCWPSANTQPMKFGWAPSTSIMDCCTRRQCQHSPAAPTGAGGDPQPSPPEGGRLGALVGRESAARSSCSSGSQAWPAIAYGCDIPNFAACSPVVQQHDYGKDHRGTPAQHARSSCTINSKNPPQAWRTRPSRWARYGTPMVLGVLPAAMPAPGGQEPPT